MEEETQITQLTMTESQDRSRKRKKKKPQFFAQISTGCTIVQESGIVLCNTGMYDDGAMLILPGRLTKEHNRFSIKILKTAKRTKIGMGLVPMDYDPTEMPGHCSQSIGYSSNGSIFISSDYPKTTTESAGENDEIALELDITANKAYFEKKPDKAVEVNLNIDELGLYPCIRVEDDVGVIQILEDDFWAPTDNEVCSCEPRGLPTKKFKHMWISPAEIVIYSEHNRGKFKGWLLIYNPKKASVRYQVVYGKKEEQKFHGVLKRGQTWVEELQLKKDENLDEIMVQWKVLPSGGQSSNKVAILQQTEEDAGTFTDHHQLHVEMRPNDCWKYDSSFISDSSDMEGSSSDDSDDIEENLRRGDIPEKDLLTYLKQMKETGKGKPLKETEDIITKVKAILQRDTSESLKKTDEKGDTALHIASAAQLSVCVNELLDRRADPLLENKNKEFPLKIAIENKDDKMAQLFCDNIGERRLLRLFWNPKDKPKAKLIIQDLLKNKLKDTTLLVLNNLTKCSYSKNQMVFNFAALELDGQGKDPSENDYSTDDMTAFQMLAIQESKEFATSSAVKKATDRKWTLYAKTAFSIMAFIYLFSLFCVTFAAITGVSSEDVTKYDSLIDPARAVFEILTIAFALVTVHCEVMQMKSHKLEYFKYVYNYIELPSGLFLIIVVPLRFTQCQEQWYFFAVGYILWVFRIFKYAAIFKTTGIFGHILLRLIVKDVPTFVVLFMVILLAFGGGLCLSLKGDNNLMVHDETSSFWNILFVGVRILTEAQPVVEYTGQDGFRPMSCIMMLLLLFVICVLLLNIFIAQLSSRYQAIQSDAEAEFHRTRARIVARIELKEDFMRYYPGKSFVKKHFKEYERKPLTGLTELD